MPALQGGAAAALLPPNATALAAEGVAAVGLLPSNAAALAGNVSLVGEAAAAAVATAAATAATSVASASVASLDIVIIASRASTSLIIFIVLEMIVIIGNASLIAMLGSGTLYWTWKHRKLLAQRATMTTQSAVCLLIPALLDHESAIIVETVRRALEVPQFASVVLTYNTKGGDVSATLKELEALRAAEPTPARLVLQHNERATSKAANLNAALSLTEGHAITFLIDADHHVTADSVRQLTAVLDASPRSTVCVQGSVLVRGEACWDMTLSTLSWYFYAMVLPAFEACGGASMFVGASACWRSSVLRQYGFSDQMIAEDDDLTMRVVRDGLDVQVWPLAETTELPAEGVSAFLSQRLRWCYGYEQSLNRHLCGLVCERPRMLLQRLFAWYSYTMTFCMIAQVITSAFCDTAQLTVITEAALPICIMTLPVCLLVAACCVMLHLRNWKHWLRIFGLLAFTFVYGVAQALLTVYARLRMLCGGFEWQVTRRKVPMAEEEGSHSGSGKAERLLPADEPAGKE